MMLQLAAQRFIPTAGDKTLATAQWVQNMLIKDLFLQTTELLPVVGIVSKVHFYFKTLTQEEYI